MADKLMYIPNADIQNYPFCRLQLVIESLNTQLNVPTTKPKLCQNRGKNDPYDVKKMREIRGKEVGKKTPKKDG